MNTMETKALIQHIREHPYEKRRVRMPGMPSPFVLISEAPPREDWDQHFLEASLGIALPRDVIELWEEASGLQMFVDSAYGQWGLTIWSPAETLTKNVNVQWRQGRRLQHGDIVIGGFLGDSDLLMLRCDDAKPDYGNALIALPIDHRDAWPVIAGSLHAFIQQFWKSEGKKFWDRR